MHLWQNAGLATSPLDVMEKRIFSGFKKDMKSNELTWIAGKRANYLAAPPAIYRLLLVL